MIKDHTSDTPLLRARWELSPVVLWRRGTLPVTLLRSAGADNIALVLARLDRCENDLQAAADRLSAALYDEVPRVDEQARRSRILRFRRNVHRGRMEHGDQLDEFVQFLGDTARLALQSWELIARQRTILEQELQQAAADQDRWVEMTLAMASSREDFATAIQLSGAHLYEAMTRYVNGSLSRKRSLHVQRTLLSFAYRSALKPSPFAGFTHVGAHYLSNSSEQASLPVRQVQLSLGLLTWMEHELAAMPAFRTVLKIRVNDTLHMNEQTLTWFTNGAAGSDGQFVGERFAQTPVTDILLSLIDYVENRRPDLSALMQQMGATFEPLNGAGNFLQYLIQTGLLKVYFPISDHSTTRTTELIRLLKVAPQTPEGSAFYKIFVQLTESLANFPSTAAARQPRLNAICRNVADFCELIGADSEQLNFARSFVYEDVGDLGPSLSVSRQSLALLKSDLELVSEVLPLLDRTCARRRAIAAWVEQQVQPGRRTPLLALYRKFSELSVADRSRVMLGQDDSVLRQFEEHSSYFRHWLSDCVAPGTDTVELPRSKLAAFAAEIPPPVRLDDVAIRMQLFTNESGIGAVLNGATVGRHVYMSRFCSLLSDQPLGHGLTERLKSDLEHKYPDQTDLNAVMGMNFNLHPRLTAREVLYPGAVQRFDGGKALSLTDLFVQCSEGGTASIETATGEPVDLVPLNFLFDAAAPPLYRFLSAFCPAAAYRGRLYDTMMQKREDLHNRVLPRITIGRLCLERRTWLLPPGTFDVSPGKADVNAIRDIWNVAQNRGLPRESFFRMIPPPVKTDPADWYEVSAQWAREIINIRQRKPHYLDIASLPLVDIFRSYIYSDPGSFILVQECLPGSSEYLRSDSLPAAEEVVVEIRTL